MRFLPTLFVLLGAVTPLAAAEEQSSRKLAHTLTTGTNTVDLPALSGFATQVAGTIRCCCLLVVLFRSSPFGCFLRCC